MWPFPRISAVLVLLLSLMWSRALCFDVSWIPADPEGPLPLSKRYRDSLRRLCALVDSSEAVPLPPEVEEIKPRLVRICARLRADDAAAGTAPAKGGWALPKELRPLRGFLKFAALGALVFLAYKAGFIDKALELLGFDAAAEDAADLPNAEQLRDARLRRFLADEDDHED